MSDAVQNPEVVEQVAVEQPNIEGEAPKVDNDPVAEMQAEIERLRKHNDTLLGEKKTTVQKAREAEAQSKQLAEEKAKRDGDYETLLKTREEEKSQVEEKLKSLETQVSTKERAFVASKVSSQLQVDKDAGEILERFAMDRIDYQDGNVVVLDKQGNQSTQSVDDLISEFQKDPRFKHLIVGTKATGSGANGGNTTGNSVTQNQNSNADSARQKGDLNSFLKHSLSGVM